MKIEISVNKSAGFEVELSDLAGLSPSDVTDFLDVKARKAISDQKEIKYWVSWGNERKIPQESESDKVPVVLVPGK